MGMLTRAWRVSFAWVLSAAALTGSASAVTVSTAGTTATEEAVGTVSASFCTLFDVKAIGSNKEAAAIAWLSASTKSLCPGGPTQPPTGDECVGKSGYLRECLACCVYQNQTILSCADSCFTAFPHIPATPVVLTPPTTPQERCCQTWCGTGAFGVTSCCNGSILTCDCTPALTPIPGLGNIIGHISQCVQECEGVHQYNQTCQPGQPDPIFNDPVCGHPCSECTVNRCFVSCMEEFDCNSVPNPQDCRDLLAEMGRNRDNFCAECTTCRNTHK